MTISRHSLKRMKERLGVPKKIHKKLAILALNFGLTYKDSSGSLQQYLTDLYDYREDERKADIKIFRNEVYVFSTNYTLITVMHLPSKFQKYVSTLWNRSNKKKQYDEYMENRTTGE